MNYEEFENYEFKSYHLYNIIRISDGSSLLRGASVKSVYEMSEMVGRDNIKIYIY